jgi:ubiquinone biosynthesis monooxygenase Coq7
VNDRPIPPKPGPGAGATRLAQILRVDHAGEVAAGAICRGQRAVLRGSRLAGRSLALIAEVEAQEARHQARFEALLVEHRARPSLLGPVWRAAGFTLGAATALIGESAAHACTEAVETVIEAHYARQIVELATLEPRLAAEIGGFRADEVAHRDAAKAEGAARAPGYRLLSTAIRAGCRAAIKVAEKV